MRIQVNARNRGYEFDALPGERILYAGLRAGIDLPYECATGTCGTCKAKLVSGRVTDRWPGAPGKKHVKPQANEFLMCQCAADEALTLEVSNFVYPVEPGACVPQACSGTVRKVRALTHDVMRFALELERPRDFDAGQFALLPRPRASRLPRLLDVQLRARRRNLDFVVKRKPDGGSPSGCSAPAAKARASRLSAARQGDFEPGLGKNLLCIAGGSGIAGMMSILARAEAASYFERHKAGCSSA